MLQPISNFLPTLRGGANLAGPVPESEESLFRSVFNAQAWADIVDFLIASELEALGLRRVARRQGPACGKGPLREAHPVGNTGNTSNVGQNHHG